MRLGSRKLVGRAGMGAFCSSVPAFFHRKVIMDYQSQIRQYNSAIQRGAGGRNNGGLRKISMAYVQGSKGARRKLRKEEKLLKAKHLDEFRRRAELSLPLFEEDTPEQS